MSRDVQHAGSCLERGDHFIDAVHGGAAVEVDAEVNLQDLDRVLEQKVPIFEGAVVPVDDIKYSMNFGPRERLTAERCPYQFGKVAA